MAFLAVVATVAGTRFSARDVIAHAKVNPKLADALDATGVGDSRRSLGRLFRGCEGHDISGWCLERIGVDDHEFYQLLDKDGITDDIHLFNEKLREWEDYYNYHRPHGALGGQTPYERMIARMRTGTSPAS